MEIASLSGIISSALSACESPEVNLSNATLRLLLSVRLGCAVGYERKSRGQIAGVGTFALISAGASIGYDSVCVYPTRIYWTEKRRPGAYCRLSNYRYRFSRCWCNYPNERNYQGTYNGAGIWMMAMVGMAVGSGMYLVGIIATLIMIAILTGVSDYEQRVNIGWKTKTLKIVVAETNINIDLIKQTISNKHIRIVDTFMKQDFSENSTTISMITLVKANLDMTTMFAKLKSLGNIKSVSFDSDFNL